MRHLTFFIALSFLLVVIAAVLFSQVPVIQAPKTTSAVIALVDGEAIARGDDCSTAVAYVSREVPEGLDLSELAARLVSLSLLGSNTSEMERGLQTQFSFEVRVLEASVANGVATVLLSKEANDLAGSCAVGAARAQIESTLKTLPGVEAVVIRIEGVSAGEELQP
ncbi:GerMN domain-containing protein [Patescibacteria group bacterium]|nr:GerMN domain-containing protein [Patescibacteria group bacterium]